MDVFIGALINILVLIYLTRRLLGVPVGWGRVLIIAALANATAWETGDDLLTSLAVTADSPPLPLLLIAVVAAGSVITGQMIVLTVLEVILPTSRVPSLSSVITGIPGALRRLRRYVVIWWILLRRGLTAYLGPVAKADVGSPRVARSLRKALTDAGVTFVKFGQMLATRADLLPPTFVRELSTLHSQVEAEPWADIRPVLEAGLDRPLSEVFDTVEEKPIAAASVAQIHAARLADGTDVVVKVQRPRARRQVTADLDILLRLAHGLERRTVWARQIGAVGLAEGFAASLHEELDYRVEVANMRGVAASGTLIVPQAFDELSSERVIVMERLSGDPLSTAGDALASLPSERRRALAEELVAGIVHQVFVTGVFHADLHPGNVVLTDDGELALLDFGSVGRLDRPARSALAMLMYAVERQDSLVATDAVLDLMDRPPGLDDRALERDIGGLVMRFSGDSAPGGAAAMFAELLDLVVRHGFRVPPQLAAVFRTLGTLDGTLRLLDPRIDLVSVARAKGAELAHELASPEKMREQASHQLAALLPLLARMPRRLSRIAEHLEDGTLQVNVRGFADPDERRFLAGIGQQLNLTLIASVLGLGGLFLLTRDGGPLMLPTVPLWVFLGVTCLFLAFTLGARVLATIFFQPRG
ncbi:AarF/ABC1/UbiB kinase family protein [Tessaracoccus sp. MC1679]|uniref:ABC1 kinase family protein n=1 Tax=Tessaracoccus sp. MC1679 TaxID=2760313 RepID=UPI0016004913|nr:AarF/UbiB family protein [Tessaracoccus sp. MC1679]MBB1514904.1 AarF/ABC1/UbiB kinase family protein [Tessaracoccus sp. MC1679]